MEICQDLSELFVSAGLSEQRALETTKNKNLASKFSQILNEAKISPKNPAEKNIGALLFTLASKIPQGCLDSHRQLMIQYILSEKIRNDVQLNAAIDFISSHAAQSFSPKDFEKASGVGIVVSPHQVQVAVDKLFAQHGSDIRESRYQYNFGMLLGELRQQVPWGEGKLLKETLDQKVFSFLGPKTQADLQKPAKLKMKKKTDPQQSEDAHQTSKTQNQLPGKPSRQSEPKGDQEAEENGYRGAVALFHKPGENYKTDGYIMTPKTLQLLKKHLQVTGGSVWTRFPPEPNGILHIGHAKAMNLNFNYAKTMNGKCYLRYDDTNPETESLEYVEGIRDMCFWLGHQPWKVTYSSDYFHELYEFAIELIKRNCAYICHQTAEQMFEERGGDDKKARHESPWRNRPIAESLALFQDMRKGKFEEGKATLRMKMDMTSGNPQMWDLVAYRVKYSPHHRSKNEWCIYPTYDFTHCLVDSLENISHSLCTREFKQSRVSYYWLCNALDVYCPVQWEYSRLNITNTVLSKRRILKLIDDGYVRDWSDPRLHTLLALRRRGFPPDAINEFCNRLGITTSETMVDSRLLESCVREELNRTCPRTMACLDPLKVVLDNYPEGKNEEINVPLFPADESKGFQTIFFSKTIYIERNDFCEADPTTDKQQFRRLTPHQSVGLKYIGYVLSVKRLIKCPKTNRLLEIHVAFEPQTSSNKPKAFIHWISAAHSIPAEVRLYDFLFKSKNPSDKKLVPNGWLSDYNPNSEIILSDALVSSHLISFKPRSVFQFERLGYFCVDQDSSKTKLVFNRTVTLKEDALKV